MALRKTEFETVCLRVWVALLAASHMIVGAAAGEMAVGLNLNMVNDYDPAWVFRDVFLQSRPWIAHAYDPQTGQEIWGAGGDVEQDEHGWPRRLKEWTGASGARLQQRLATLMYREIGDHFPAGIYRAEWRGTGEVVWGFAATELRRGRTRDGRHVADLQVTPDDAGIYLKINAMDPSDPIRGIHVWAPQAADSAAPRRPWRPGDSYSPFQQPFVERLGPFHVIRFMDWGRTNANMLSQWAERPTPEDARQTDPQRGVAIEYMVALANETRQHAWINIPLRADDDYVRHFATYVRDHLSPELKLYVEWSNENWNYAYGFQAARWLDDQTAAERRRADEKWGVAAREIRRDFAICCDVFGEQRDRLVRVVAGQAANVAVASEQLARMEGEFDAVAVAAYCYLPEDATRQFDAQTTVDEIFASAERSIPQTLDWIEQHRRLTENYSRQLGRQIELVVYEGGQHFETGGKVAPYQEAIYRAQSHPRMEQLYDRLLDGCRSRDVSLFLHYAYASKNTPHGSWGAFEYQDAPLDNAPKYRALVRAARRLPDAKAAPERKSPIPK